MQRSETCGPLECLCLAMMAQKLNLRQAATIEGRLSRIPMHRIWIHCEWYASMIWPQGFRKLQSTGPQISPWQFCSYAFFMLPFVYSSWHQGLSMQNNTVVKSGQTLRSETATTVIKYLMYFCFYWWHFKLFLFIIQ